MTAQAYPGHSSDVGAGTAPGSPSAPADAPQAQVDRREERKDTNWIAVIRLLDGTEIACNVKDVSPSGARLGIPSTQELPDTFMMKVVGRDFVCLVRQAWRRGNFVGVHIERIGKLAPDKKAEAKPQQASGYTSLGSRQSKVSSF